MKFQLILLQHKNIIGKMLISYTSGRHTGNGGAFGSDVET